jgi:hypothetical protein
MVTGVAWFVFGSIRQSAPSCGVVAQMLPAPAATFHTPAYLTVGKGILRGELGPTARTRTTCGFDQSEAHTVSPSTTAEPGSLRLPRRRARCRLRHAVA